MGLADQFSLLLFSTPPISFEIVHTHISRLGFLVHTMPWPRLEMSGRGGRPF
jgi:hypothetical protein